MAEMSESRRDTRPEPMPRNAVGASPLEESRLVMMRRVKRMTMEERIALLDRLCREGTRIALQATRIK